MPQPIRLLEVYLPGLRNMPAERWADVQGRIAGLLLAQRAAALVIAIPDDEMLLFLITPRTDEKTMRDLVATVDVAAVAQRVVDAQLIRGLRAPPGERPRSTRS